MISDNARMLLPPGLTDDEFEACMDHFYRILLARDPEQSRFLAREVRARDAAAAFGFAREYSDYEPDEQVVQEVPRG